MTETSTDTQSWCEERLRQPHEDLHLARLFSPPELRSTVSASAAIYIELEATIAGYRDLNVARTKLAWWRDELTRLEDGRPAHPATKLLASGAAPPAVNQLLDLVTGMELNLLVGPAEDLATAELVAERGFAQFAAVLGAQLETRGKNANLEDYLALGKNIGLSRRLQGALDAEARADIAAAAGAGLRTASSRLPTDPPALRVLAALAWRRASRPSAPLPQKRESRRRVFIAWRAARGKLPRGLRSGY
ncbi:MAG: squalene/phytoene synthase family protein [Gammaproteobacteria bacterium]